MKNFRHSEVNISPAQNRSIQVRPQIGWIDTIYAGYIWENNECNKNRWGVGSNHSPGETGWLWVTVSFGNCFVSVYLFINILPWHYQCPAGKRAWYRVVPRSCDRLESESKPQQPPPRECHRQKSWTERIPKRCQEELIAHSDDIHLARLRGCGAPGSGDWLHALPSSALGLSPSVSDRLCPPSRWCSVFWTRICVWH